MQQKKWIATASYQALKDFLEASVLQNGRRVDFCVALGLGCFTGAENGFLPVRQNVSLLQLAAFKMITDICQPKKALARDPLFNQLDEQLLLSLGIRKFDVELKVLDLGPNVLIFAPFVESFVALEAFKINPPVYIGVRMVRDVTEERRLGIEAFWKEREVSKIPRLELPGDPMYDFAVHWRNGDWGGPLLDSKEPP